MSKLNVKPGPPCPACSKPMFCATNGKSEWWMCADHGSRERWIPASQPPVGHYAVDVIVISEKYALAQAMYLDGDAATMFGVGRGFYYVGNERVIPAHVEWWIPLPERPT